MIHCNACGDVVPGGVPISNTEMGFLKFYCPSCFHEWLEKEIAEKEAKE